MLSCHHVWSSLGGSKYPISIVASRAAVSNWRGRPSGAPRVACRGPGTPVCRGRTAVLGGAGERINPAEGGGVLASAWDRTPGHVCCVESGGPRVDGLWGTPSAVLWNPPKTNSEASGKLFAHWPAGLRADGLYC